MIEGVIQTPLKQFHDDRGKVMHMLRSSDKHFVQFGEVYFSWIFPDIIKAWHQHSNMVMNYAVPVGSIKVVLYDDRKKSSTFGEVNEFYMSAENYYLLTIPNNLWYGFKVVGTESAMVANCSTTPHNSKEIKRIPYSDPSIPYNWDVKHG
jgi:dTDP-4-dehydrorhamnose 3,5-epimerase